MKMKHSEGVDTSAETRLVGDNRPGALPLRVDPLPGEYQILQRLGEGAFAIVYLAEDLKLKRQVALKALKSSITCSRDRSALEGLQREAQLLARVNHPNIVRIYSWREDPQARAYLVMQYVAGGSFAERLRKEKRIDWKLAARYIADIGDGLLKVHELGVVHRDLKPENILWQASTDEALLTDFGICGHLASADDVAGTPLYMPREALQGQTSKSGDVYSLAATLFHLITGAPPFHGPGYGELMEQILRGLPDPDSRFCLIPEPLEEVIRAGMAVRVETRPSMANFVCQLRATLNRLSGDALATPMEDSRTTSGAAAVRLNLEVKRQTGVRPLQTVAPQPPRQPVVTRDMKRVPPLPQRVPLSTGDRVLVELCADSTGYATVFNVGPTGNLNLLYPEILPEAGAAPNIKAGVCLPIGDVVLTPPEGLERLIAIWSRRPLPLRVADLQGLVDQPALSQSRPYVVTRDMLRIQESLQQLPSAEWRAIALELDHVKSTTV
jgi:serine/threonine protein kinase